jgi:hypothetical protein
MDDLKLVEILETLTEQVIRLREDVVSGNDNLQMASLGLLRGVEKRLVRERHRIEFERESKDCGGWADKVISEAGLSKG